MRVLISGSTGFVGTALTEHLKAQGHEIVRLVRRRAGHPEPQVEWHPERGEIDAPALTGIDGVVHLAGESVFALRWTDAKKERIRDSRVNGTQLLSRTLAELPGKPRVLVSASAVGYYGDCGDAPVQEDAPPADTFLAQVCRDWEAATAPAAEAGIRVAHLRVGVVLHPAGGALKMMLPAFRMGAGGVVGSGSQYMPWIAREDLLRAFEYCLTQEELTGPVNGTAPNPVTNREFTEILGNALKRPTLLPVPTVLLRGLAGAMADEMLLASCRALPGRLRDSGFSFKYAHLQPALHHMLHPGQHDA